MGLRLPPELERRCLALAGESEINCDNVTLDSPPPPTGNSVSYALRKVSEKFFMWKVISFAEDHKWRYFHVYDSRRCPEGFPDLILLRPGRIVLVELKSQKGKATVAQQDWLEAWRAAGAETYVWRPADMAEIERILA